METRMDRETASRTDDHQALRLWLRLLTCTQLVETQVRIRLRELSTSSDLIHHVQREMLALVQLDHLAARKPAQLSGGPGLAIGLGRAPSDIVAMLGWKSDGTSGGSRRVTRPSALVTRRASGWLSPS